jgi:hypothetical protein
VSDRIAGCYLIAMILFSTLSVSGQTALEKPVVAKLNVAIDASKPMAVNQLYFAQILSSKDDRIPPGSLLAVQIAGGTAHGTAVRTSTRILHLSSPPATTSRGIILVAGAYKL